MNEQIKVFKPSRQAKILFLMAEAFVVFVLFGVVGFKLAFGSGVISVFIWVCVLSTSFFVFRLLMSERLRVTPKEIVENNIFTRRRIVLATIEGVWVGYKASRYRWIALIIDLILNILSAINGGGSGSFNGDTVWLFIKTHDGEVTLGHGLEYSQLNEAASYIIEQIRIFFPENYTVIEIEEQRKQEEKRQKEREAVVEFWSK